MENQQLLQPPHHHHSSLPLLSKTHRLDSFMKYVVGKTILSRWSSYVSSFGKKNKEYVPLDVAVLDANSKGSLLDRIESLEDRLIQLSLEIETRRTSRTSTSTSSGTREPISSYPVFNNPKPKCKQLPSNVLPVSTNGCDLQRKSQRVQQKQKQVTVKKVKNGNNRRNEKKSKNGEKKGMKTHRWPHLKMLGC